MFAGLINASTSTAKAARAICSRSVFVSCAAINTHAALRAINQWVRNAGRRDAGRRRSPPPPPPRLLRLAIVVSTPDDPPHSSSLLAIRTTTPPLSSPPRSSTTCTRRACSSSTDTRSCCSATIRAALNNTLIRLLPYRHSTQNASTQAHLPSRSPPWARPRRQQTSRPFAPR